MVDFSMLGSKVSSSSFEPRDIFMSLPTKSNNYEYPRDVQSEVWKSWYLNRDTKNTIVKMNTGSGKTVVGLTILKSCHDEGKGPSVYVAPDNYLVQQVCDEANKLGIAVSTSEDDYEFLTNRSILVINIHKLVNGKSIFGMRESNNIPIGSVLIDDVHACIGVIEEQFTIKIPSNEEAYDQFVKIFADAMKQYSERKYQEVIEQKDPNDAMPIPFWIWQNKVRDVRAFLYQHADKDFVKFNYPLIENNLSTCNCIVSASRIEITPKCLQVSNIRSFNDANRRIFMSATLADDSAFVSTMGLSAEDVKNIITPEKANDIGDRLILFPQVINKQISDDEIKAQLVSFAIQHNVIVIVPSWARVDYWRDVAQLVLDRDSIYSGVNQLKNEHVGLVVLVNKYEGIDLPDEACRLLVVDGLPDMRSEYDKYLYGIDPENSRLVSEQVQKIEQGMGRGVRSHNDFCVTALMGRGLCDVLFRGKGLDYFSEATKTQFSLSQELWDQLRSEIDAPTVDDIFSLAKYSLSRDYDWMQASKKALSAISYDKTPHLDQVSIALRESFEKVEILHYREAVEILQNTKNNIASENTKGFLMQTMAEYLNFENPEAAQQILLSALRFNKGVTRPINGINFQKLYMESDSQAQALIEYVRGGGLSANGFVMRVNSILDDMVFAPETAGRFEAAIKDISFLLGYVSSRPEHERGKGPDNLWALGNGAYFVIECKNGAVTELINKHDCNQLNGSVNWFDNEYRGNDFTRTPIMIHNSNIFEHACSPCHDMRIMTPELLKKLRKRVQDFAANVSHPDAFSNAQEVHRLLLQFKLDGNSLLQEYTKGFQVR